MPETLPVDDLKRGQAPFCQPPGEADPATHYDFRRVYHDMDHRTRKAYTLAGTLGGAHTHLLRLREVRCSMDELTGRSLTQRCLADAVCSSPPLLGVRRKQ